MTDKMIDKSVFYYDLPKELISQEPCENRSDSRLFVLSKDTGDIEHRVFSDIVDLLNAGDCIVLNDTKVLPMRLLGVKSTGAAIEVLLLKRLEGNRWEALVKPGRKVRDGDEITFGDRLTVKICGKESGGVRIVELRFEGVLEEVLEELGEMPLPPYITKKLEDKNRYQTVYAEKDGSSAAPTAGLHFTNEILDRLAAKGVKIAKITLHVGLGTFRPIKTQNILEHEMHSEYYRIDMENAEIINTAKSGGGRIICVGTTSVRTLESVCKNGVIAPSEGYTDIFIYPGYKFKITDCLLTNFHLPESTLMALVSAFAGVANVTRAYEVAVKERYRFFSFGDCMFIY